MVTGGAPAPAFACRAPWPSPQHPTTPGPAAAAPPLVMLSDRLSTPSPAPARFGPSCCQSARGVCQPTPDPQNAQALRRPLVTSPQVHPPAWLCLACVRHGKRLGSASDTARPAAESGSSAAALGLLAWTMPRCVFRPLCPYVVTCACARLLFCPGGRPCERPRSRPARNQPQTRACPQVCPGPWT